MHAPARIGLASLFVLPVAALSAPPVVVDLGENLLPQAISNDGAVVVGIGIGAEKSGVFRWPGAGPVQLLGGLQAGRPDVSADGLTISGAIETDRPEAAFWTQEKGWVPLSAIPDVIPALPGWATLPFAISANGQRLAGSTVPPPIDYGWERGFSFNPDTAEPLADFGWQELPKAGKSSTAWASGTSNDGAVQVGSAAERGSTYFAARWVDGFVEELRDDDGMRLGGETVACNSDCTTIVGGGGPSSAARAVLAWRLSTKSREPACYFEAINPTLPALRHYAYGLSEKGNVVTGAYYYDLIDDSGFGRNVARGFLWLADKHGGTLVDLQAYLAARGQTQFKDWQDLVPTGLSADGRYLVGWGVSARDMVRGWRIDFGQAPRATGPMPVESRYTRCPKQSHHPKPRPESADEQERAWPQPQGTFRAADGRYYQLHRRGASIYGGPSDDQLQQVLPLGGDHYYDTSSHVRLSIVRDPAGQVVAIRARQEGANTILYRQSD